MIGKLRADKFSRDVVWNITSLGIAGVCGVLANFLVGVVYGAGALGVFNQVFAVYLVFAQLAVLGVHTSVLTYGAAEEDLAAQRAITSAGLALTLVQAVIMAAVFAAIAGPVASVLDSPRVAVGILWAAPGLVFFALNKVALAVLNARRRMRWYAIFQAGRVVVMAAVLGGCGLLDISASVLPVALSIGEGVIFVVVLVAIRDQLGRTTRDQLVRWAGIHWRFGVRGFLSGMFSELNTRVDVFILGAYATDSVVGAYSLAALIAEGLYQVLIALRTNYAPIIVRLFAQQRHEELLRVIRKGCRLTYAAGAAMTVLAIATYALLIPLITGDPQLVDSRMYFAVLLTGMACSAGYAPFNQLLLWAGRPGAHTILIAMIVTVGAAANVVLASQLEALGASIASGATFVWSVIALKLMVRGTLRLRI